MKPKADDLLFSFKLGERVKLARSRFADRIGMRGTVIKVIKSRRVIRYLRDDAKSASDTYDAEPENLARGVR